MAVCMWNGLVVCSIFVSTSTPVLVQFKHLFSLFQIDKYEKESIRDASTITQLKRDLANLGRSLQEKAGDNAKLLSQVSVKYTKFVVFNAR